MAIEPKTQRVNEQIRTSPVRVIAADGSQLGIIPTADALAAARQATLDLVEVAPQERPPVCRIMDFGKYRYDESVRKKQARKHAQRHALKEIKFHSNVAEHDYATKVGHVRRFLEKGHKVKVSLQFRGRENAHRELGFELVNRVLNECEDIGAVDMQPRLMGRMIVAMLGAKAGKPVKS